MRSTSIIIGGLVLLAACSEPSSGPSRRAPTAPSYAVGNGAEVARGGVEQSYADTVITCEGDVVAVEANLVGREQILILPDGGLRSTLRIVVRMRGTVLSSGAKYVGEVSWISVRVYHGPDSDTGPAETRTIRLHGVTQGPSDNVFETISFETSDHTGGDTIVIKGRSVCPG